MLNDPRWFPNNNSQFANGDLHARLHSTTSVLAHRVSAGRTIRTVRHNPNYLERMAELLGLGRLLRRIRVVVSRKARRARAKLTARALRKREQAERRRLAARRREQPIDALVLEPRIVFDAAAAATFDQANDQAAEQQAAEAFAANAGGAPEDGAAASAPSPDAVYTAAVAPSADRHEIAFVDAGVADIDRLVEKLPSSVEVVFLSADRDGVQQIADALEGRDDIGAIHILSHGTAGELTLGNAVLDSDSIGGEHEAALARIGEALSQDGDILIYGCDFGADSQTLSLLAEATGADIAASTDDTGHTDLGGDWDLEAAAGEIEAEAINAAGWLGRLDPVAEQTRFDGRVEYAVTGGSLRAQPDASDPTALNATSQGQLILPGGVAGADVQAAFLYWAGSGAAPDTAVSLNGQSVTADQTHLAQFDPSEQYFSARADVTALVRSAGAGTYTFGDLTVDNGAPFDGFATVMSGWSLAVVYEDSSLPQDQTVVLMDGFELLYDGSGQTPATTINIGGLNVTAASGRLTTTVYEGDPNGSAPSEAIRINGATVAADDIWDSASNTVGVNNGAQSYGVDIDTFDISALIGPGDTQIDVQVATGNNDQVFAGPIVVSFANQAPIVDVAPTLDLDTSDNPALPRATGNAVASQIGPNNPIGSFNATDSAATGTFNVSTASGSGFDEGLTIDTGADGVTVTLLDGDGNSDGAAGAADTFSVQIDAEADNNSVLEGLVLSNGSATENTKDMTLTWSGGDATVYDPDGQLAIMVGGTPQPADGQTISSGTVIRTLGPATGSATSSWSIFAPTESLRVEATAVDRPDIAGSSNDLLNESLTFNAVLRETGHADTFLQNGSPVPIASSDIEITDDGQITRAEAQFFVASTGDELIVDPASLPAGISVDPASTASHIILTGAASVDDYEAAIRSIQFQATATVPDVDTIRNVEVTVTDNDGNTTKVSNALIDVLPDNDGDGVEDAIDIDDDNDGILDVVEAAPTFVDLNLVSPDSTANMLVITDVTGQYRLEITKGHGDAFFTINPTTGVISGGTGADQIVSLIYSTKNSPIPFDLEKVRFNDIDSMSTTSSVRDAYAVNVPGTWVPIGTPTAGVISIDPSDTTTGDGDGLAVGNLVRPDGDATSPTTVPTHIANFQRFLDRDAADGGNGQLSDVYVNFEGAANDHVAELQLDDPTDEFTVYVANTAVSGMFWSYTPTTSVAVIPDTDVDGLVDAFDIDSDDDGILDNIEAQSSDGYIAPTGIYNAVGLDLAYVATNGLTPQDSDAGSATADGRPDYIDLDSDNDGTSDNAENGLGVAMVAPGDADTDRDGLKDAYESVLDGAVDDGFVVNEGVTSALAAEADNGGYLPDADGDAVAGSIVPLSADLDYRDASHDNSPPAAQDDGLTGDEDSVVAAGLFADNGGGLDADPDGDTIAVTRVAPGGDVTQLAPLGDGTGIGVPVTGSGGGTFTVQPDGSVSFDPGDDFNGLGLGQTATTQVVYQIDDGQGGTDTAVVTYTVTGLNDAPIPVDPAQPVIDPANPPAGTPFDPQDPHLPPADPADYIPHQAGLDGSAVAPLDLTAYFGDPDAPDAVTLAIDPADLPDGLVFDGTAISGTPSADASQGGDDPINAPGVYTIPVTATDPHGATFTTNVTYTIANPPPAAQDDGLTGDEDSVVAAGLFADNGGGLDADPDGDTIAVTRVAPGGDVAALAPLGDGTGIGVPVAGSGGGTFTVQPDGSVSFDPGDDFNGLGLGQTATTQVVYQIDDGQGGTDTAVVTYTVTGLNDGPIPVDPAQPVIDPANPPAGTPFDPQDPHLPPADPADYIPHQAGLDGSAVPPLDLTAYFGDPDAPDAVTLAIDPADLPDGLVFDGTAISGTPAADASQGGDDPINAPGVYTIPVTATDPHGATFTTNVTYTIANPPPAAVDDGLTGDEDSVVAAGLFADNGGGLDADPDGDTIAVTRVAPGGDVTQLAPLGDGTGIGVPVTGSGGGTFTVQPDGSVSFDHGDDFNGLGLGQTATTQVVYQIDDGQGGTDTAVVTYTVTGLNDAPIPVDPAQPVIDPANPPAGTPFDPQDPHLPPADPADYIPHQAGLDGSAVAPLDLTAYFGDPDAPDAVTLAIDPADLPDGLVFDGTAISGTPSADASQGGDDPINAPGVYTIPVTATDPHGATFTTNVTYTIANPPPAAQDDGLTGDEDSVVAAGLFADNGGGLDADPDGDTIAVTRVAPGGDVAALAPLGDGTGIGVPVAGSGGGTFTVQPDGSVSFDPGDDFNGLGLGQTATTQVVYQIDDGQGGTDTAVVTYTVTGLNDGPIPVDPAQPVIDPANPPAGTPFDPQDPHLPPADPADYIPHQAGLDGSAVPPLDLTAYFGDPDAPDAVTLAIDPADLPDGLVFDGTAISGTPAADASQGGDDPINAPGVYTIPVTATDPHGATFTTNVTYTIANPPPAAVDDGLTGDEDSVVAADLFADNGGGLDADPDGDTIAVTRVAPGGDVAALAPLGDGTGIGVPVAGSGGGTFTVQPDGSVSFDPGDDFNGLGLGQTATTQVVYQIDDGQGGTDTAVVTYTVTGLNDAPIPVDPAQPVIDPANPPAGTPFDPQDPHLPPADPADYIPHQAGLDGSAVAPLDLTAYFGDPDAPDAVTLAIDPADLPDGLVFDGTAISGTPSADASQGGDDPVNAPGVYTIPVTATDPHGATFTTNVTYTIANPPPAAQDDAATAVNGETLHLDLLGNDKDPDGDKLVVTHVAGQPAGAGPIDVPGGTVEIDRNGRLTFVPDYGFSGTSVFTYEIADADGAVSKAVVRLAVTGNGTLFEPLLPDGANDSAPVATAVLPASGNGDLDTPLVILEAVDEIDPLGSTEIDLSSDGIVLRAVNGVDDLGSIGGRLFSDGFLGRIIDDVERLEELARQAESFSGRGAGFWDLQGLTGFSLRADLVEPDGGFSGGQIVVDTLVRDRTVFVSISDTLAAASLHGPAIAYEVQSVDGGPLPEWLDFPANGSVLANPPAGETSLELEIVARFADGARVVHPVSLDLITGEVSPLAAASSGPGTFLEEVERQADPYGALDSPDRAGLRIEPARQL